MIFLLSNNLEDVPLRVRHDGGIVNFLQGLRSGVNRAWLSRPIKLTEVLELILSVSVRLKRGMCVMGITGWVCAGVQIRGRN